MVSVSSETWYMETSCHTSQLAGARNNVTAGVTIPLSRMNLNFSTIKASGYIIRLIGSQLFGCASYMKISCPSSKDFLMLDRSVIAFQ